MADDMLKMNFTIDKKTERFFSKTMPDKLQKAKEKALEAMGMKWADTAKTITRDEGHVVTGLYVNSIGYSSGGPATEVDVVHEIVDQSGKTILKIGSNVAYAETLEKRYNIFADALDQAQGDMVTVAKTQIKKTLGL